MPIKPYRFKLIFLLGLCALLFLPGCGQKSQHPGPQDLKFSQEISWPEYSMQSLELDNGMQVFLIPHHELPLINLQLQARFGSFQVPQGLEGLEQIWAEALQSGGSQAYPRQELSRILEDRAAKLRVKADTQMLQLELSFLKEDLQELLPVLTDLLRNPLFPEDRIHLAKRKLKGQISRRNDSQSEIASRKFKQLIYGKDSVYAQVPEYESVDRISRQDLERLHSEAFQGANLQLGLVGDFQAQEMRDLLQKELGRIKEGQRTELEFPEVDYEYVSNLNLAPKRDVNQSYILLGHIGDYRQNQDYAALQVLNEVLSGGFSGRLFRNLRSRQGLAYSVFGRYGCEYYYPGMFFVGLQTKSSRTAEAIQKAKAELSQLQEQGVREKELEQAKDRFLNSLVFRYDNPEKVLSRKMQYAYWGMDLDSFSQLAREVRQVESADVNRVAREYLRPQKLQVLVVGTRDQVLDQLEELGEVRELELD
ncbi:MAG: M16 family metallopeptidase [Desulfohalobiaceae bacterium]